MKISLKRTTKSYVAGDEVTAQITEVNENNGNLGLKLYIIENGKPGTTFFYHSIGSYAEKGRYYLEQLLNHIGAPEDGEIDEKWFIGKRVTVILGDYIAPSTGKKYINIASFVDTSNFSVEKVDPFGKDNDLTFDIPFGKDEQQSLPFDSDEPKKKTKTAKQKSETLMIERPDFTTLLDD